MREEGKLNLTERKNFDEKSWFWTTTEEKRKIYYFYNNYNTETSNVIEIRSNIIRLAEKKWKDVAMVKKIIIKQTNEESKKFDNNKCFTDISKSIMNTDISGKNGKKINKDFSCIIF